MVYALTCDLDALLFLLILTVALLHLRNICFVQTGGELDRVFMVLQVR